MKRQFFSRGLLGFPLGIAIGYVISIAMSGIQYPILRSKIQKTNERVDKNN